MKKISFIITVCLTAVCVSCNEDAIFEKEMYRKVVALVSSGDYNVFEENHELTGNESVGYIAASVGGTENTSRDIVITLEEDTEQFDTYNKAMFDADESAYARLLPPSQYVIDDYTLTIPAGMKGGKTMIKVNPEGLSPDSTYLVSLKINNISAYELNEKKSSILYRVMIRNDYASQANQSSYVMEGYYDGVLTGGNKRVHPLSWNKVRLMAGTQPYQADAELIAENSIVLEVTYDNKVRITPYRNIVVEAITDDPEFNNTFRTEESNNRTYNVFTIAYKYSVGGGTTHTMRETLRMVRPN